MIARLSRIVPLLILLAVVAGIVYLVATYRYSPSRAKEILIKMFTWLTGVLSAFFLLVTLYALLERNEAVLDLSASFLATTVIGLMTVTANLQRRVPEASSRLSAQAHEDDPRSALPVVRSCSSFSATARTTRSAAAACHSDVCSVPMREAERLKSPRPCGAGAFDFRGGEAGIRTLDALVGHTHLAGEHLSASRSLLHRARMNHTRESFIVSIGQTISADLDSKSLRTGTIQALTTGHVAASASLAPPCAVSLLSLGPAPALFAEPVPKVQLAIGRSNIYHLIKDKKEQRAGRSRRSRQCRPAAGAARPASAQRKTNPYAIRRRRSAC